MIKRIYEPETGLWQIDEDKFINGKLPEFNNCGNDEFVKILCENKETAKILIENIEKSVAKEPQAVDYKGRSNGNKHKYICPNCDYVLKWAGGLNQYGFLCKYCPKCGQKIDWSELEE